MKASDLSREELFVLVWERPTIEVALELGISDVALGKLCKRLQVPKPPRGYWARVASGRTPKKPPLPAYRAEIEKRIRRQYKSNSQVRLSKLQLEFVRFALDELTDSSIDTDCELAHDGIHSISHKTAAQILIVLQTRYEKWLSDRTTAHSKHAGLCSMRNLVSKLQPHAKEQLLIFHRKVEDRYSESDSPAISIRATEDFLGRIAHFSRLARDNGLAYATADMSAFEHAWPVHQVFSPRSYSRAEAELCVSSNDVWVRGVIDHTWSRDQFETVRMPLRDICPVNLLPSNDQRLPSKIRRSGLKPYAERLQALLEAQALHETLISATYETSQAIPNEKLALFDRLLFSREEEGPFMGVRKAWRRLEADLERWEQQIDSETIALCQDVLGIEVGDIALVESANKLMRIEVEGMMVYTSEKHVTFSVWGKRFRKDGLPGKRSEYMTIAVENDLG